MRLDFTHAFVEAGNLHHIIDVVHPATGRSAMLDETLDQIRLRYPKAELVELSAWLQRKAAAQDAPVIWSETTRRTFYDMLEVLPPACQLPGGFLVGEPDDHHAASGQPRFRAYRQRGARYEVSSRPMTIREFKEALR